jgi:hypothetical protein
MLATNIGSRLRIPASTHLYTHGVVKTRIYSGPRLEHPNFTPVTIAWDLISSIQTHGSFVSDPAE